MSSSGAGCFSLYQSTHIHCSLFSKALSLSCLERIHYFASLYSSFHSISLPSNFLIFVPSSARFFLSIWNKAGNIAFPVKIHPSSQRTQSQKRIEFSILRDKQTYVHCPVEPTNGNSLHERLFGLSRRNVSWKNGIKVKKKSCFGSKLRVYGHAPMRLTLLLVQLDFFDAISSFMGVLSNCSQFMCKGNFRDQGILFGSQSITSTNFILLLKYYMYLTAILSGDNDGGSR